MLIAGTQSGCGKTTVTLALMQAARRRGLRPAPFKAGPDFLDPLWHHAVCDRVSYNLDTRMMSPEECHRCFAVHSNGSDIRVIEGAMGLFDGASGVGGAGSAAHLAAMLGEEVCLVVSAKGMSGSLVPLVAGFNQQAQAMGIRLRGIIANQVGSEHHASLLRELLAEYQQPPLLAWMKKGAPALAERHLGLCMPDGQTVPDFSDVFHMIDDDLLRPESAAPLAAPATATRGKATLAVARDAAFSFIYAANIEHLQQRGITLRYFSPLAGEPVPSDADALWLPGGYPELYGEALSRSASLASLAEFIAADRPVLAECGGMMVLGERLHCDSQTAWPMAGVLPCDFVMQDGLAGLGYREDASGMRGHEFHHSRRVLHEGATIPPAFELPRGDGGIRYRQLRASYVHWYFPSAPEVLSSWLRL